MTKMNINSKFFCVFALFLVLSPALKAKEDPFEGFSKAASKKSNGDTQKSLAPSIDPKTAAENAKNDKLPANKIYPTAQSLVFSGQSDLAAAFLWKRIEHLDLASMALLGSIAEVKGHREDLRKISTLTIGKFPTEAEGYAFEGHAYLLSFELPKAKASFMKAIEMNPKFRPAYLGLAKTYNNLKNPQEERVVYQDMLTSFGKSSEVLTRLCDLNVVDGLNDQAMNVCKEAIKIDPKIPDNHVNFALIHRNTGDMKKLKAALKSAATSFPASEVALFEYGNLLSESKNFVEALDYFENCVAADSKSARCWVGVAVSGYNLQKWETAYLALKKACNFGRKYAVEVRKAVQFLRTSRAKEWLPKFEDLAAQCAVQ